MIKGGYVRIKRLKAKSQSLARFAFIIKKSEKEEIVSRRIERRGTQETPVHAFLNKPGRINTVTKSWTLC
jgi:hypothetical protein